MPAKFFFIPGMCRSGTTWVTAGLREHPEVAAVQETYLIQHALDLLSHEPGSGRIVSRDRLRAFLMGVYEDAAGGKPYLVDKSPANFFYKERSLNETILNLFPDAKILWLVRDGKNFVHGHLHLPWPSRIEWSVESATRSWIKNVGALLDCPPSPNILIRRYEDLLGNPSASRDITEFLGISHHHDIVPWQVPCNTVHEDYDGERWRDIDGAARSIMRDMNPLLDRLGYSGVD